MKNIILFLLIILLSLNSCMSTKIENPIIPECISAKIAILKTKKLQNPPAEVWQWNTVDKTYYYITSDCCDQYNYLYNTACDVVCAPDGGLTGKGDGKCPDFNENEIVKTLIWKDDR